MPTKAVLEEQLAEARAALTALREAVREEVVRVANQQDWCEDGQRETLRRLGLGAPIRARITITLLFEGDLNVARMDAETVAHRRQNPNFIGASVVGIDEVRMDNDFAGDCRLEHENTTVVLLDDDGEEKHDG